MARTLSASRGALSADVELWERLVHVVMPDQISGSSYA